MPNKNALPLPSGARNNIGGAVVTRSFSLPADAPDDVRQSGRRSFARVGANLSEALVRGMKNRRALEDNGYIKTMAKAPQAAQAEPAAPASRFAFHTGFGKFDVIEGQRINASPLSKEEAEQLVKGHEPPARAASTK